MDNLTEKNSGKEVQIPTNWNFLERGKKGLGVTQIDLAQRFLSFGLPDAPGIVRQEWPNYKGEYGEYFFDVNGKPIEYLSHYHDNTVINLRRSDMETSFNIWEIDSLIGIIEISIREPKDYNPNPKAEASSLSGDGGIAYFEFDSFRPNNNVNPYGLLKTVSSEYAFARDRTGSRIKSPTVLIVPMEDGLTTSDWKLSLNPLGYGKSFEPDKQEKPNEVFFRDKKGELVFKFNWEVKDGKLIVSETHLPTQITKILRVPVIVPMNKVAEAVFSRPPYEKMKGASGLEHLAVPWRDIDRIVGASFSYSRPISR